MILPIDAGEVSQLRNMFVVCAVLCSFSGQRSILHSVSVECEV